MREKLIQYVELLFAGVADSDEVRQEILQNTLDRYDDLVSQGKAPEAAYRLAIAGIGDINEVLPPEPVETTPMSPEEAEAKKLNRKMLTGLAIGLYILCPVPLFIFQNEIGLCLLLVIVAIATGILIWRGGEAVEEHRRRQEEHRSNESELERSISRLVSTLTVILYLAVSFWTGAWYITWIIFPLAGAVKGLVKAILDLKEAQEHENR